VNNVLVPVKLLISGASIVQVKRRAVTYFHVELPRHAVILAEGLPVESYLDVGGDVGGRANFQNASGTIRLFPDFAALPVSNTALAWETRGAAALVTAGSELAAVRRQIEEQTTRWSVRTAVLTPARPARS
jgi:hypothetical protein